MKSACSNSTFLRMDMSGSIRIQSRGESALQGEEETTVRPNSSSGGRHLRRSERRLTPWPTGPCRPPLRSSVGSSFSYFWMEKPEKKPFVTTTLMKQMRLEMNKVLYLSTGLDLGMWNIPSALGVTGDVMLEAVLLDLKHVVKGSVQFLHGHLNGTLQTSKDSSQQSKTLSGKRELDLLTDQVTPSTPPPDRVSLNRSMFLLFLQQLVTETCFYTRLMCQFTVLGVRTRPSTRSLLYLVPAVGGLQPSAGFVCSTNTHTLSFHTLYLNAHHIFLSTR